LVVIPIAGSLDDWRCGVARGSTDIEVETTIDVDDPIRAVSIKYQTPLLVGIPIEGVLDDLRSGVGRGSTYIEVETPSRIVCTEEAFQRGAVKRILQA